MNHTQYPWRVVNGRGSRGITDIMGANGRRIAKIIRHPGDEPMTPMAQFTISKQDALDAALISAAPSLYACIASFLANWPQFETDEPINGADLVDWLADQLPYWRHAVTKADGGDPLDAWDKEMEGER